MTIEERKAEWVRIESVINSLERPNDVGVISDGIVNQDQWISQAIRPLFIGKEAYNPENEREKCWSITKHMDEKHREHLKYSKSSWRKTAYIAHSLQNQLCDYNDIPKDQYQLSSSLQTIAFINTSKLAGSKTTSYQRLGELFLKNQGLLLNQIDAYSPNIIIGWNTLPIYRTDDKFIERFANGSREVHGDKTGKSTYYWLSEGRLFIKTSHPAYVKISPQQYVKEIIDIVNKNQSEINLSPLS